MIRGKAGLRGHWLQGQATFSWLSGCTLCLASEEDSDRDVRLRFGGSSRAKRILNSRHGSADCRSRGIGLDDGQANGTSGRCADRPKKMLRDAASKPRTVLLSASKVAQKV